MGTSGTDLVWREREDEIWELRISGWTLEAIGDRFEITRQRVHQILKARLEKLVDPRVDEWRQLENARIEVGVRAVWAEYIRGHKSAVDSMVRLMERRARLLGLDAPSSARVSLDYNGAPAWERIYDEVLEEIQVAVRSSHESDNGSGSGMSTGTEDDTASS